jgi:hypothetical protein
MAADTSVVTAADTSAAITGMHAENSALRRALLFSHSARRWWDSSIDANSQSRWAAQADPLNMAD